MPRYIHLDVSTGALDAMGMACIHPVCRTKVERLNLVTQIREEMFQPVFELDFALRIVRDRADDPIDFGKIRYFIWWMKKCGFDIRGISCDLLLLSHEMRSILTRMGFKTSYLSMDRTKSGYEVMKNTILEGRLRAYQHNMFILEAANLEDGDKKIDHPAKFTVDWPLIPMPPKGSKDVTDGVGGAIYTAVTDIQDLSILPYVERVPERLVKAAEYDATTRSASVGTVETMHHVDRTIPDTKIFIIE